MKKMVSLLLLFAALAFQQVVAQKATVIKLNDLDKILHTASTDIQVINFWATWCGPCVKELPLFEKLNSENPAGVKITLINLDYADKVDKVNSFLARKKMKSAVLLLDEIDYNSWIDKVDPRWGGAIPATLIINPKTGQRKFIDKEIHDGDLEKLIAEVRG